MRFEFIDESSPSPKKNSLSSLPKNSKFEFVEEPNKKSFVEKAQGIGKEVGRHAARGAKTVATRLLGIPGDLEDLAQSGVSYVGSKLGGIPYEEARKTLDPFRKYKNTGQIREIVEGLAPDLLKAQTTGEEKFDEGLDFFTQLVTPGPGGKVGVGRALVGTALGLGAEEAAKQFGFGEGVQGVVKMLGGILPLVAKGKFKPTTKEATELYNYGKSAGMTDEMLTPLLQKEGRLKGPLGKLAKKTAKAEEQVHSTKEKLGELFSEGSEAARDLKIPPRSQAPIVNSFEGLLSELKKSHAPSAEKVQAIKTLEKQLKKMRNFGVTGDELEATYRDLNQAYGGRAGGSKPSIEKVKNAITDVFEDVDPKFAKEFKLRNQLYSKYKDFEEIFGNVKKLDVADKLIAKALGASKTGTLVYSLIKLDPILFAKGLAHYGIQEGAERIATKLLTDPKWQSVTKNALKAAQKDSPKLINLVGRQVEELIEKEKNQSKEKKSS